jgi:hypothetical protein
MEKSKNTVKELSEHTFAFLLISGIVVAPLGLVLGNATLSAFGNAMFFAGYFTPIYFVRYLDFKQAIFGGMWTATVLYFVYQGKVSGGVLLTTIPMFIFSVVISKWSGAKFQLPTKS